MTERNLFGCAGLAVCAWATFLAMLGSASTITFLLLLLPPKKSNLATGISAIISVFCFTAIFFLLRNPCEGVQILPRFWRRSSDNNRNDIERDERSPLILH